MYPVSGSSGQDEPVSPGLPSQTRTNQDTLVWIIRFIVVIWIVSVIFLVLQDEGVKLRTLHATLRACQTIARIAGQMALLTEREYNDLVDSLH